MKILTVMPQICTNYCFFERLYVNNEINIKIVFYTKTYVSNLCSGYWFKEFHTNMNSTISKFLVEMPAILLFLLTHILNALLILTEFHFTPICLQRIYLTKRIHKLNETLAKVKFNKRLILSEWIFQIHKNFILP